MAGIHRRITAASKRSCGKKVLFNTKYRGICNSIELLIRIHHPSAVQPSYFLHRAFTSYYRKERYSIFQTHTTKKKSYYVQHYFTGPCKRQEKQHFFSRKEALFQKFAKVFKQFDLVEYLLEIKGIQIALIRRFSAQKREPRRKMTRNSILYTFRKSLPLLLLCSAGSCLSVWLMSFLADTNVILSFTCALGADYQKKKEERNLKRC